MNKFKLKPKILIVDDKPENLYVLEKLLTRLDVEVIQTTSSLDALSLTLAHDFCLAIVDVQMPEMDGYELVELLRGNADTSNLPVIFISAIYSDEYHHRKGYDTGAVDFLSKPFVPEILVSKVKVFLDLCQQRNELEKLVSQVNAKNEALEREIKQRQQVEVALRKANNDKAKLFSIIAHDLRGPFQPLLGNAKLLMNNLKHFTATEIQIIAQDIYKSTQAVFGLLENLLTWSRLQQEQMKHTPAPIELHKLAENTVHLLAEVAHSKKIHLTHTIEAGLWVYADKYMIDTVIRNLTTNALKFTPAEGHVTLTAHRYGASADNGATQWVEVAITDTGVGINQKDISNLFKANNYFTTPGTDDEAGTGLGLMLCQEMIAKNGGRIWIESEEHKGTTVRFTLPIHPSSSSEKVLLKTEAIRSAVS